MKENPFRLHPSAFILHPPWGTLGTFTVRIDGLPSDKVAGMGLPPKNKFVVYLLTFQRAMK
jgi:hypothetical protein